MQDGGQQGGGHPTNLPHNRQPGPYLPRGWASAPWAPPRPTPSPAPAAPAAARSPAPGAGRTLQGGGGGRRGNKLRRWGVRTPAPSTQHLPAHLAPPRSSPLTSECDGHLIAAVPVGRALRHEDLLEGRGSKVTVWASKTAVKQDGMQCMAVGGTLSNRNRPLPCFNCFSWSSLLPQTPTWAQQKTQPASP